MRNLSNIQNNREMIISFMTIRRAVGILGILLPVVVLVGNWLFNKDCHERLDSISHYYYTVMGSYLVGTLCAVGLFLYTYRGYEKIDNILSNIAGILAVGVAFFPTDECCTNGKCNILDRLPNPLTNGLHVFCAAGFLLILAYMSLALFTKSTKRNRNRVYRVCGWIMIGALLFIAASLWGSLKEALSPLRPVFYGEWVALWAFGISWLTKGLP